MRLFRLRQSSYVFEPQEGGSSYGGKRMFKLCKRMTFSIQDIINEAVSEKRENREQTSWHASKLGSCVTGQYLERLGVKADEEFDERTLRVFSVGKMLEDWLVGKIAGKVDQETQVRIENKELRVTGYADLLIKNPPLVYEIKSKQSKSFWYMDKQGQGAGVQHKMQLWVYLYTLGVEEGRIIYLSKDDLATLEYPVLLGDKEVEKLVKEECAILNEAWEKKIPPKPPTDVSDWRTKFCRYHKQCTNQTKYL